MRRYSRKSSEHSFWESHGVPTLTACRTIMFVGHETTAKSVGISSSALRSLNVALTNFPADLWTLGVGQTPGLPGETTCKDQPDSNEGQGERRC